MPPSAASGFRLASRKTPSWKSQGLCQRNGWKLASWDIDQGLTLCGRQVEESSLPEATDPLSALKSVRALGDPEGVVLLGLKNYHRFLGSAEVVQALHNS